MSARILRLLGLEYFVRDLERTSRFYTQQMGFSEVGRSRLEHERVSGQRALLFRAGDTFLVDGSGRDAYLLQVFLEEATRIFGNPDAGPFFFELIERKGDAGFGAGNFKALFDSVEGQQLARTA